VGDQAGILRAIVENPDDVTHRLVYADWLEDSGQELLARFIRDQCSFRQFLLDPEAGARYPVAVEVMQLRPELRAGLLEPFRAVYEDLKGAEEPLDQVLANRMSFWVHRGFVEDVEVHGRRAAASFARHAGVIFSATPLLRLTLTPHPSRASALAPPTPGPFPVLPVRDNVSLEAIGFLLRQKEVARLRSLDLRHLELGDALVALLLGSPPLRLDRLMLDGNRIEATLAAELRTRFGKALLLTPHDPADDIPF
jgi:uncharacterized protein (TIGR02996 family)